MRTLINFAKNFWRCKQCQKIGAAPKPDKCPRCGSGAVIWD
jgi:rubrerythrin